MPELEIGLVDGGKLNFNQSFLKFNVKKKIQGKGYSRFDFTCRILDTASFSRIYCYDNANFTIAFLSEKDTFFKKCKVHSLRHTSLTFICINLCKKGLK